MDCGREIQTSRKNVRPWSEAFAQRFVADMCVLQIQWRRYRRTKQICENFSSFSRITGDAEKRFIRIGLIYLQ